MGKVKRHKFGIMVGLFAAILVSFTVANQLVVMRSVDRTTNLANDALEAAALGEIEAALGLEGREVAAQAAEEAVLAPIPAGTHVLDLHPEVASAFASFDEAIDEFADLSEDGERDDVADLVEEHEQYVAAVIAYLGVLHGGGDAESLYSGVLLVERDVTHALLELREEEVGSLLGVVESVRSAGAHLQWGIPGLSVFAIVIALLLGMRVRGRRKELEHVEQLSDLYGIGTRLAAAIDLGDLLDIVAYEARSELDADTCAVVLLGDSDVPDLHSISTDHAAGRHVWDARTLIAEARDWQFGDPRADAGAARVVAPLMAQGSVIGAIAVYRDGGFSVTETAILDMVASQAALALRNARLDADVERGHGELQSTLDELRGTRTQLLQAQRHESIGELAAGIAHEINTPVQFIGDSAHFLGDGFANLLELQTAASGLAEAVKTGAPAGDVLADFETAAENANLDFLKDEIPSSVGQIGDGVARISEIVSALKDFSGPGTDLLTPVDINKALDNTLIVARKKWSEIAEVETVFDPDLPPVPVLAGPLNQALLNIIINAAQAIGDAQLADLGTITVSTSVVGEHAEISIADTGLGVPEGIRDRVFDPFFTTRQVGDGTGQGLSTARNVIVDQHGGELSFTSQVGIGTRFRIRLPLAPAGILESAAAEG
jgi:signal transduction histidine kinase